MAFSDPQKNVAELSLERGMKVVDIGSGSGSYVFSSAKAVGENGRVYAVDIQQELLKKLKNEGRKIHLNNIDVVWGDAEIPGGTKLADSSFDAVILSNLLFQIKNKEVAISEAGRILKTGGKMLVVDWTNSFGGLGPQQKDVFSKNQASSLVQGLGFSLKKEFDAGDHHYGLIFVKK